MHGSSKTEILKETMSGAGTSCLCFTGVAYFAAYAWWQRAATAERLEFTNLAIHSDYCRHDWTEHCYDIKIANKYCRRIRRLGTAVLLVRWQMQGVLAK